MPQKGETEDGRDDGKEWMTADEGVEHKVMVDVGDDVEL